MLKILHNVFAYIYKNAQWILSKKQRKTSKRSKEKITIFFWRRKRKKGKKARHRYKNLPEEEKEKKRQYHEDRNKNLSEEEKQKKVEYMRNYYLEYKNNFYGSIK